MASNPTSPTIPKIAARMRRRPRWRFFVVVILIIGAAGTAVAFYPGADNAARRLGPLTTHTVARGDLQVTVTEQGTLASSNNTEIKCRVRGDNTIIWVVESGTEVQPGDELVRLDTLLIEEEISERTKFAHLARSGAERAKADVMRSEIAIKEYEEGQFVSELATLQKDLAVAKSNLLSATNMVRYSKMLAQSEYASELDVEEKEFAKSQAGLNVSLIETQIDVLQRFTKKERLATLKGELDAAKAKYEAERERAAADQMRLDRALEELDQCVILAQRRGMVIYPSGKEWEEAPDIEEGATVHKDQVLLLMPDLTKMQVKVGIHESIIKRIKPGLTAKVTLPAKTLEAEITSVAAVAKPAGWWTGNVVKYDTIVALPPEEGLKPGMSVEVEVVMAEYEDVLLVPTSAVISTKKGHACWIKRGDYAERRSLKIGDASDMFIVVEDGLKEGEDVILDPLASVPEAQDEAASSIDDALSRSPMSAF